MKKGGILNELSKIGKLHQSFQPYLKNVKSMGEFASLIVLSTSGRILVQY